MRWIVMRFAVTTRRPSYGVSRLPIGWWERAAHEASANRMIDRNGRGLGVALAVAAHVIYGAIIGGGA
jgi:hypothetical protein